MPPADEPVVMRASAPGSSANIGPGFDTLSLAIDWRYELSSAPVEGFRPVPPGDLAWVALESTGARVEGLWFRSAIPPGRGMGSSAAARVAAAYLGSRLGGTDPVSARAAAFTLAAALEGHPDNAAAAAHGGLTLTVGGRVHAAPPAIADGQLFMWVPPTRSDTEATRARLDDRIAVRDAVAQAGACAAVYAGLLTGSWDLLRHAHDDRIHEAMRLADLPESRAVLDALRAEGHVAWLSGSGPSIAALVATGGARVVPAAPGEWCALAVDNRGCVDDD